MGNSCSHCALSPDKFFDDVCRTNKNSDLLKLKHLKAGNICQLSLASGGSLTVVNSWGDVRLRPWEHADSQKWEVEIRNCAYGFRNMANGRFLGIGLVGGVKTTAREIGVWEGFTLQQVVGNRRYVFKIDSTTGRQRLLARSSLADYSETTTTIGERVPITITAVLVKETHLTFLNRAVHVLTVRVNRPQ